MSNLLTDYISAAYAVINNRTERLTPEQCSEISEVFERGGYLTLSLHTGEQPEVRLTLLDTTGKQTLIYALRQEVTAH